MISKEIETVNDTKIFCGLNSNQTKQITIYSNKVNNISDNNAMVLPVPFPESVNFHDMTNYKTFFDDCESCFYLPMLTNSSLNSYSKSYNILEKDMLKVFNVGSYKVSLAYSLDDLCRINKNVFDLSRGLKETLKENYTNSNFGFIICKLVNGYESYHPFAYSHKIFNSKVFIPTKHYHKERNFQINNMFQNTYNLVNPFQDNSYADDWSHDIYLYNIDINTNTKVQQMNTSKYRWNNNNKINLRKLHFDLDTNCKSFQKVQINGSHPNIDLILYGF